MTTFDPILDLAGIIDDKQGSDPFDLDWAVGVVSSAPTGSPYKVTITASGSTTTFQARLVHGAAQLAANDIVLCLKRGGVYIVVGKLAAGVVGEYNEQSWNGVSFTNSWTNFGGFGSAAYRKLRSGLVLLRGVIKSGTVGASAFTLASGYRPADKLLFYSNDGGTGSNTIEVRTDGTVVIGGSATTAVMLDPIRFLADGS